MSDFLKKWESAFDKKNYRDIRNYAPAPHGVNDPNASHYLKSEVFNKLEIATLLSGKEDLISQGTTAQYFRGDKTWQLLNTTAVPEGLNLYFTDSRARAALTASSPISYNSSTGNFSLNYNTTNLKLTSNQLDTIQNISTTSTPTFAQLTLNNAGTTTSNAVRADRAINTSYPITGGGNLTADRTIGLNYNTTNLRLTSNQLNTIQDIATNSSPTFNNLTATGTIKEANQTLSSRYVAKYYIVDSISPWPMNSYLHYIEHNRFAGRHKLIAVYIDDVKVTTPTQFFDLNFEGAYSLGTAGGSNVKLRLNFTEDGLTSPNGFTYSSGYIYLQFYPGRHPANIVSVKSKNKDGVWTDLTSSIVPLYNYVGNYISYQITANPYNYITDFEFIFTPNPSQPVGITEIMYIGTRMGLSEGGMFTVAGGSVFGDINLYNGTTKTIALSTSGNSYFNAGSVGIGTTSPSYKLDVFSSSDIVASFKSSGTNTRIRVDGNNNNGIELLNSGNSKWVLASYLYSENYIFTIYNKSTATHALVVNNSTNNVGINTATPSYKLDVSGTGRFTDKLTLDNILEQKSTSGTNQFYANIEQFGNKSIGTNPFASGWTGSGWRIDKGITASNRTHLELDDLTVRGTMRVYELIINQIRATNGSLFVSSSAKVLSAVLTTGDPETYTITFEDPEGHGVCPFLVNDIILVQRVRLDSTTLVKQIALQVTSVTGITLQATVLYRNGTIDKNDLCVRIGNTSNITRQGSVYLTSDDANAPFIDIVDGVNSWSTWSGFNKLKARLGKLDGITDSFFGTLSGYGLYAKSNAYLRGKIYAEQGGWIAGWTIDSARLLSPTIVDGAGYETNFELVADGGSDAVGAYLNYDLGVIDTPIFLSFGNIKDGYGNFTGYYGISFRQGSSNLFELSNNTTQIAGWNFDYQRLYKSTNIELNSATDTIGVNSNKVKLFYTNSSSWGIEGRDSSNNLVFQLGSTNKIAGWNFIPDHIYKLTSGTPTTSPAYGLTISATSSASVVIAYGSNWQRYVKLGYQTSGNWFGLEGTDSSGNLIFQLGSTNKISGWNFDTTKLSNGIVSLEASSTMKGLVVDTDKIKIGSFTYTSPTNSYSDITSYLLNGYSGINSGDTWWGDYGQTLHTLSSTSQIYLNKSNNTLYHYVNTDANQRATDIDQLTYGTIHRLFTDTERVLNRKIKIDFKLRGIKYQTGTYHDLFGTVNIIYFNSSWAVIKREQVLYFQFLESQVPGIGYANASVIDKTGANAIEIFAPGNIPDIYAVYIEFTAGFLKGGQYKRALDFEISDLKFYGYEGTKTLINEEGLMIYNSDMNYLSFRKNSFEINAYDIKVANYPVVRFLGKYSTAPQYGVKVSDIYINSTDGKVYICSGFNSSTPQWTVLN
ncbi:MAG: hypothetical protein KatS3mg036_0496 [Ignavibacterium sp.]|uniref:hypothetical protein n=1 Tax=Ignavibacterium sp. TaxID=2651167 RepID=UPI0021DBB5EC|nr:hypothetical protein [Ignavibacterium sp.]BDQ01942.1 MAG: hypothetical protein KatS3mg037_0517 [Ignavibacterium sp.]GIV45678.1 MAG: hypothetical protein KatS3mg036_0496 [Ignavibacterium sp.]